MKNDFRPLMASVTICIWAGVAHGNGYEAFALAVVSFWVILITPYRSRS